MVLERNLGRVLFMLKIRCIIIELYFIFLFVNNIGYWMEYIINVFIVYF